MYPEFQPWLPRFACVTTYRMHFVADRIPHYGLVILKLTTSAIALYKPALDFPAAKGDIGIL
jgi:hypothetical protein